MERYPKEGLSALRTELWEASHYLEHAARMAMAVLLAVGGCVCGGGGRSKGVGGVED